MLGWFSAEAARASRWKRSVACGRRWPIGQEFQRDVAAEPEVLGPVHHTHAASTQPIDNPIVRNDGADHLEPNRAMPGKPSEMAS